MANKKTEIAKVEENKDLVPEWMKGKAGKGTENFETEDLEIPRIKLLHGISPEVQNHSKKPGSFYHTVAEEELGDEVRIIPIYISKSAILFRPEHDNGGGILARASADMKKWMPLNTKFDVKPEKGMKTTVVWDTKNSIAESGLLEWGSSNPNDQDSPPAAVKMQNMICWLPDHPELSPAVLTFQKSTMKTAKRFMAKLKISDAPIYGSVFTLSKTNETNKSNQSFFGLRLVGDGFVEDKELFDKLENLNEHFTKEGFQIKDEEGLQGEGSVEASDDNSDDDSDIAF